MSRNETVRFLVLRSLGNFLVLLSLYGVFMTFGPALTEEVKFRIIEARGVEYKVSSIKYLVSSNKQEIRNTKYEIQNTNTSGFADILAGDTEQILIPSDSLFSILIPKLGASAKVFPNVDPGDKDVYLPILKKGVAHASGTSFPGLPGTTYLFAHSADNWWDVGHYNAVFYTLHNLSEGDEIIVFFENRRYDYVVSEKLIVDPTDVSYLTSDQQGESRLVLQTCWPPGTTFKRLFVVATPKNSI